MTEHVAAYVLFGPVGTSLRSTREDAESLRPAARAERQRPERRWQRMSIRCVVESAFFIAWGFLERSGELGEPGASANIILDAIEAQLGNGERRQLMLANKAIAAYREHVARTRASVEREARSG
ncbi:hypothetical protein [Bradyrhizobium neotropicale]